MAKQKTADGRNVIAQNKRATYDFEVVDTYTAGLKLTGTEVKSVRGGKASLGEGYCYFKKGELFVKNMHIPEYKMGNLNNHEPKRERKLLLTKRELRRLEAKVKEKGFTIVPLELFISDRGLIKLDIALVRGKTKGDKRQSIKAKDIKRDMQRELERYR